MSARVLFGLAFLVLAGGLIAQENGLLQSGIKVGDVLPGPFDAVVVSGKVAKDRQHSLVTEYGLLPVVMVFAREAADGKDATLMAFLTKLDDVVNRHKEDHSLGACVIFLSPFAQNSTNNVGEADPKKLVEEALKREELAKRLEQRAEKLKNVVVAYMNADGPKDYRISPKAEVTVLFYQKHKVLANFACAAGKLTAEDADRISAVVEGTFAKK